LFDSADQFLKTLLIISKSSNEKPTIMLRIAHQIICINMGIAWKAVPSTGATTVTNAAAATTASLFRRWQSGSSGGDAQDVQESMDKVMNRKYIAFTNNLLLLINAENDDIISPKYLKRAPAALCFSPDQSPFCRSSRGDSLRPRRCRNHIL
jgi:hypothetical protein